MNLTQANIDKTVENISEIITLAPMGLANWADITAEMTRLFPGSFSGLINYDTVDDTMPFLQVDGIEESFLHSYVDYYHTINPYEKHWREHNDGAVWVSDYVLPISKLRDDEFYNDWMSKMGEFDSAIGVKLHPTAENEVRFNIQFPTRHFTSYEAPVMQIFNRVRAPLYRAISITQHLSDNQIKLATSSALLDRNDKAACVVDISAHLKEGNGILEEYLETGTLFKQEQGKLFLRDHKDDDQFKQLVRQVALFASAQSSKLIVRDEQGDWILSCSRLPNPHNMGPLIPQPLVLVVITRLGKIDTTPDLTDFAQAYHLTRAEERLCAELAAGCSLSEAATRCSIKYETARSRIKDIFSKTQTSKQTDLILLLEQYRSG